ncbi:hypothetical protein C8R45DRAFT_1211961 [Mycena sanguinolenta]|nr:hypothetical protein C8R45DRAFT_1211961 [Mycena sanguinolenta]
MARRRNDENTAPSPSTGRQNLPRRGTRPHKSSEWAQKTRDAKAAQEKAWKEKKLKQARQKALKQRQRENALTVDRPGDTEEIRVLRAALARAQGQCNAAEAALPRVSRTQGPAERSIARPRNMSKITITEIRNYLGLAGAKHDERWADLRGDIGRFMDAGMLDLDISWKEQDNRRLGKVYNAIEDAHPNLKRFRGQWATISLVHESFGAQKTYKNYKKKAGTYRAKIREARMSRLERLHTMIIDSDDQSPFLDWYKGTGPRAPSHSPNSSPSPPASPNRNDGAINNGDAGQASNSSSASQAHNDGPSRQPRPRHVPRRVVSPELDDNDDAGTSRAHRASSIPNLTESDDD